MNANETTSSAEPAGCEVCGCPTCPPGYRVTIPDAFVQWESLEVDEEISCGDLEQEMLLQGPQELPLEISNIDVCSDNHRLDALFRSTCGCPALPTDDATDLPTPAPVTVTNPPSSPTAQSSPIDPEAVLLGDDPVAVVRQHPILVACIIVVAFAVAGIYLVCQLRCTKEEVQHRPSKGDEEDQAVQVAATSTTLSKEMGDVPAPEAEGATEHTTTEVDGYGDELQTPGSLLYITTDDLETVSDYGSVVSSYNVQL